ncbi:MAG: ABC transporter ATP-binding protein [Spirochaetaceae bacterium]|jgi:ABC-2 type transport system ATP-binding protein|nr:ABC transporter ATP-binding protein [Spirochaetaceae bacterium]
MSEPILECRNLSKRYGSQTALNGVNLCLERGRIAGLLGPNGSGKTTLIKLANGLLQPSDGEVLIGGGKTGVESKAAVSYLPDRFIVSGWMRITEILSFFAGFYADFHRDAAETMLANLGIRLDKQFKTLSKGNREKVQLILVMARTARLYLLDEPIGGVDPAARDYIINTIINNYSEDAAVLISTHQIQEVEQILDDVVFLKEGGIILQGRADDIRSENGMSIDRLFREVFKC